MRNIRDNYIIGKVLPLIICLLLMQIAMGQVIYVDDDANGLDNGTSWTDAYNYLQDALANAQSGDEIWVAQGIYTPDQGGGQTLGDREATFQLINSVALFGGFPDIGDPGFNDRDPNIYKSVLTGDLAGNDIDVNDPCDLLTVPTRDENCYHVLYHPIGSNLDTTAILDGFIIIAGNADASLPHNRGGGMYNEGCSPKIVNCIFTSNSADSGGGIHNRNNSNPTVTNCAFTTNSGSAYGGGMFNSYSGPLVTNCTFNENSTLGIGGGMLNSHSYTTLTHCVFIDNSARESAGGVYVGSNETVTNCTFNGNSAAISGGGIYIRHGSPILLYCNFIKNSAGYYGGGMYNHDGNSAVTNCFFVENSSMYGGGICGRKGSKSTLTDCMFVDNSASSADNHGRGGGVFSDGNITLTNCTFRDNFAREHGGGMDNPWGGNATLNNCNFFGNSVHSGENFALGGGMHNDGNAILTGCIFNKNAAGQGKNVSEYGGGVFNGWGDLIILTNCTFISNSASNIGGGIYNDPSSKAILTNCILWDNTAKYGAQISLGVSSSADISYSNIQGGRESIYIADSYSTLDWGLGNIDVDPLLTPDGHLRGGRP